MAQWTEVKNPETKPPVSTPPVTSPPEYRGRTYDTRYTPIREILPYLEGSPWVVMWYSNVLNKDNQLTGTTPARENTYHPLRSIKNLVMRVTSPLATSQDATSKEMISTGTAIVYGGWVPNTGDIFIGDIGDGRDGQFIIVNTERLSIQKDAAYRVEYEQRGYASPEIIADLEAKTTERFVFVHSYVTYGRNPLVAEATWDTVQWLRVQRQRLVEHWSHYFFSNEFSVYMMPSQAKMTYDHFVSKAARSYLQLNEHPNCIRARVLNADEDPRLHTLLSIYDAVAQADESLLRRAFSQCTLVSTKSFHPRATTSGIAFSYIPWTVYPTNGELTVEQQYADRPKLSVALIQGIGEPLPPKNPESLPPIAPAFSDGHYVMSGAFWRGEPLLASKLEVEIRRLLRHEYQDLASVREIIESFNEWSLLDRFYQTLLLLMVIDAAIWRE